MIGPMTFALAGATLPSAESSLFSEYFISHQQPKSDGPILETTCSKVKNLVLIVLIKRAARILTFNSQTKYYSE